MAINKAIAGQAKFESIHFYNNGSIRAIGKGVNEDGATVRVDKRGSYTDENDGNYITLTEAEQVTIEKAAAIIAANLIGFEGGDVSKVETELTADRTASIKVKEAEVIEAKQL